MLHDLTIAGRDATLVPLTLDHAADLLALVDDQMWFGMTTPTPRRVDDMAEWVRLAHATPARFAFAVVGPAGEVRGSTSFYDVDREVGRCEIGHTFYGRTWWGGRTNPSCKLVLLRHAFEEWGMHRVALRGDARNTRSVAAMRRLGAVEEGVLRGHRVAADGSRGDTVYFSVLAPEWPAARTRLEERLAAS